MSDSLLQKYLHCNGSLRPGFWKISSVIHFLPKREGGKMRPKRFIAWKKRISLRHRVRRMKSKARSIWNCGTLYLIAYNLIYEITTVHASRFKECYKIPMWHHDDRKWFAKSKGKTGGADGSCIFYKSSIDFSFKETDAPRACLLDKNSPLILFRRNRERRDNGTYTWKWITMKKRRVGGVITWHARVVKNIVI